MKKALLILLVGICIAGCAKKMPLEQQMRNDFLSKSAAAGAYSGENPAMTYLEFEHQVAINIDQLSFRLQRDNQLQYLMLTLSDAPKSVGQMLTIAVQSLGVDGIESRNYDVEYRKTDMKSMWFWSKNDMVGFVIPIFDDNDDPPTSTNAEGRTKL